MNRSGQRKVDYHLGNMEGGPPPWFEPANLLITAPTQDDAGTVDILGLSAFPTGVSVTVTNLETGCGDCIQAGFDFYRELHGELRRLRRRQEKFRAVDWAYGEIQKEIDRLVRASERTWFNRIPDSKGRTYAAASGPGKVRSGANKLRVAAEEGDLLHVHVARFWGIDEGKPATDAYVVVPRHDGRPVLTVRGKAYQRALVLEEPADHVRRDE